MKLGDVMIPIEYMVVEDEEHYLMYSESMGRYEFAVGVQTSDGNTLWFRETREEPKWYHVKMLWSHFCKVTKPTERKLRKITMEFE